MKNLIKTAVCSLGMIGLLASTPAQSREFADIYAECGLGGMIFSGESENNRILAIISNVTWDLGTTAILSDASSEANCQGGGASTAAFIKQTYPSIERDLARGEGEYLYAMLDIRGCDIASRSGIVNELRSVVASQGVVGNTEMERAGVLYNSLELTLQNGFAGSCKA